MPALLDPQASSAFDAVREQPCQGTDGIDLDGPLLDVTELAHLSGGIVTFQVTTRDELDRVLSLVPEYHRKRVGVVILTRDPESQKILSARGAQQLDGYTPAFVVRGASGIVTSEDPDGTLTIAAHQLGTRELARKVQESGIQTGTSTQVDNVESSKIDIRSLHSHLGQGGRAHLRLRDSSSIPRILRALFKLNGTFPLCLRLSVGDKDETEYAQFYWDILAQEAAQKGRRAPRRASSQRSAPAAAPARPHEQDTIAPLSAPISPVQPIVVPAAAATAGTPQAPWRARLRWVGSVIAGIFTG